MWILGWGCFFAILAVVRARRRRLEWRNQPGLSVISPAIEATPEAPPPGAKVEHSQIAQDGTLQGQGPNVSDTQEKPNTSLTAPRSVEHIVPPDVFEYLVTDFRPHIDVCKVDLHYPDIDFAHWSAPGMAAMKFTDGDETLTVFFQDLDRVPFDDVHVRFDHPRKGPQCYPLSKLADQRESEIAPEQAAHSPDAKRDVLEAAQGIDDGPKKFHDFDATKECIEVFVPEDRLATTAVSISSTPDGSDSLVLIDGRVTAVLVGAIDAGPHNVKLVAADQTVAA